MIDVTSRRLHWLAASMLCVGLAGCGSSSGGSGGMQSLTNIVMFQSTTPPPAMELPPAEEDNFYCPQVIIADGGAAVRAQSGADSSTLRHQISILRVARECKPTGNGGFGLKIGVEGRVLIGRAGGPGSYYATLNMQVLRSNAVVARRAARVGGTVPSGQGGVDFTHVEDGIVVPPGTGEVEIIIGLGQGGAAAPVRSRRRR